MMVVYNKFNTRQLQVYAAICLWVFCVRLGIKHESINQLIKHLVGMLTANNLPDWEQEGLELDVIGRGDPLPNDVIDIVPTEYLEAFSSLIESCVEVGIVDMYGESTDQPKIFLKKCINILESLGVDIPVIDELKQYRNGDDAWGEAISESELHEVLKAYGVSLS